MNRIPPAVVFLLIGRGFGVWLGVRATVTVFGLITSGVSRQPASGTVLVMLAIVVALSVLVPPNSRDSQFFRNLAISRATMICFSIALPLALEILLVALG